MSDQPAKVVYPRLTADAELNVCPKCFAAVPRQHLQAHEDWHALLKMNVSVAGFGLGGVNL